MVDGARRSNSARGGVSPCSARQGERESYARSDREEAGNDARLRGGSAVFDDEPVELLADRAIGIELEERIALALAVDELGERERTIVIGTYGAGLTQSELGARLGLSQSHVSKLLTRALHKLGQRVA